MLETWIDHNGRRWPTPTIRGRLKFKIPLHAALRVFVFVRDNFTCDECGVRPARPPRLYTGRNAIGLPRRRGCLVMDHVLARANGGSHHPSNLRTKCRVCNTKKAGAVDAPESLRLRLAAR